MLKRFVGYALVISAVLAAAPMRAEILERWPPVPDALLQQSPSALAALPIDHSVPAAAIRGGSAAGARALRVFVSDRLSTYHEHHNHPDDRGTSRLSPYLHFGHVSAHDVFGAVMKHERWNLGKLAAGASGAREGWWGVGRGAEAPAQNVPTITIGSTVCRLGPVGRLRNIRRIRVRRLTRETPSNVPRLTTRSGMRRNANSCATVGSTTTCECSGARRSWSGLRAHGARSAR